MIWAWLALSIYVGGALAFPWIYRLPGARPGETLNVLGIFVCSVLWPLLLTGFVLWAVATWYIDTATGGLKK